MAKQNYALKNQTASRRGSQTQHFTLKAPAAQSVELVGDFTNWLQAPISLEKQPDGIWHTSIKLTPGSHPYRFLVDGQWQDDPKCGLHAPNPFGSEDAIRQVA